MLVSDDLHGVMAMMPAFTTPDGADIRATVDSRCREPFQRS